MKVPSHVTLKILDPNAKLKERTAAPFYDDGAEIAQVTACGRTLVVTCVGETRAEYKGNLIRSGKELIKAGINTDRQLSKIDEWVFNPWFAIWDSKAQNFIEGEIYGTVNEAIEAAADELSTLKID